MIVVPGFGIAGTDVGEIGTGPHGAEHGRPVENVIAGHGTAKAPAALDIGPGFHLPVFPPVAELLAADLLAVAVHAPVGLVNLHTGAGQPAEGSRIGLIAAAGGERLLALQLPEWKKH